MGVTDLSSVCLERDLQELEALGIALPDGVREPLELHVDSSGATVVKGGKSRRFDDLASAIDWLLEGVA